VIHGISGVFFIQQDSARTCEVMGEITSGIETGMHVIVPVYFFGKMSKKRVAPVSNDKYNLQHQKGDYYGNQS
jgi:hypothetical protein